ncbi:MAG: peptidase domain-containing ABC transporter [Cellvibrionaceae bacterium]|nr:peptidase domain-containing ABC transporter [Cellvibrionaceae bacterium]
MKLILQSEISECGLACIAMLLNKYGKSTELYSLRQKSSFSSNGATLEQIVQICADNDLRCRALSVDIDALESVMLPAILHWDFNHFVVLEKCKGGRFSILDPARGKRTLKKEELSNHFTGIMLEVEPTNQFMSNKEKARRPKLSSLWSSSSGVVRSVVEIVLVSLVLQIVVMITPFYAQLIIDDVIVREAEDLLLVLFLGFSFLLLFEVFVRFLREFLVIRFSAILGNQMSNNLFSHLVGLSVDYFQKRNMGDVVSRFSSVHHIKRIISSSMATAFLDGVMAFFLLIIMAVYSIKMTIIVFVAVFVLVVVRFAFLSSLKKLEEERLSAQADVQSHFMETIRAIQPIKIFSRERLRHEEWSSRLSLEINKEVAYSKLTAFNAMSNVAIFGLGNLILYYFAALDVIAGGMTVGMMIAFISFKTRFEQSVGGLISSYFEFKMIEVHMSRLADIVFTNSSTPGFPKKLNEKIEPAALKVSNLSYRYSSSDPWVFKDVSFDVESGESVAIVGPSGVGKSTLVKCMAGLYSAEGGAVTISDGHGVTSVKEGRVSAVLQGDQLLSGSILENIAFFDKNVDVDWVKECARLACIYDDIDSLPLKFSTRIGEMGAALSGGQVQRIILARALYVRPGLLILDEATSHLDIATERKIMSNLNGVNLTKVSIAHRQDTIDAADRVIDFSNF